jgi:hypothetical protein
MKLRGGGPIVARTLMEEPEASERKRDSSYSVGVKNDIKIARRRK